MKCRFDSTGTLGGLKTFFVLTAIFSFSTTFVCLFKYDSVSAVSGIIFLLSAAAGAVIAALCEGCIIDSENQIVIYHKFFSRKVLVSRIPYEEIEYADYTIESRHSRFGFEFYLFTLKLHLTDGREILLSKELDIPESLPMEKPDEYKEYVSKLPLTLMCRLINEKVRNAKQ